MDGFKVSEELEEVENELSKQGKKTDVEAGQRLYSLLLSRLS